MNKLGHFPSTDLASVFFEGEGLRRLFSRVQTEPLGGLYRNDYSSGNNYIRLLCTLAAKDWDKKMGVIHRTTSHDANRKKKSDAKKGKSDETPNRKESERTNMSNKICM